MNSRSASLFFPFLVAAAVLAATPGLRPEPQTDSRIPDQTAKIAQARDKIQEGWNAWNEEAMKAGRDRLLSLLLEDKGINARQNTYLYYYAGLGEYRLAVHAFASGLADEAASNIARAKKYLEKLFELQPGWGEPYALYAALLGYEIALNPDRGMELGMKTFSHFGRAESAEPRNPRVFLLKGLSLLYWPAEYGGGPDNALVVLARAEALFENDESDDPLKPSWGLEECLTFMARAHVQKGEKEKAMDCLKRASIANPDYGLARQELLALQKDQ
ncbi:MAG: hypothetical protein JW747_09405 [Candidatus Aminicenantes bacterium]|nr:hypothetical protein [Candidatus Aminicenantes bacterium]